MPIYVDKSKCPQDHPCPAVSACPVGALSQEGLAAPVVDETSCVECGICVDVCPTGALQQQ